MLFVTLCFPDDELLMLRLLTT